MKSDDVVLYGECKMHGGWVPRDEMMAINCRVFDAENNVSNVRLRFCPNCYKEFLEYVKAFEWKDVLVAEHELPEHG